MCETCRMRVRCSSDKRVRRMTLRHIAIHCGALQHTAKHCNKKVLVRPTGRFARQQQRWILLQHTAIHSNTQQHIATHSNTVQQTTFQTSRHICKTASAMDGTALHCNTLQYTAKHCNTLQHTATHCNILQYIAIHYISDEQIRLPDSISDEAISLKRKVDAFKRKNVTLHVAHRRIGIHTCICVHACVCVRVCVCVRERKRVYVCMCV